jgi:hypothetical protein
MPTVEQKRGGALKGFLMPVLGVFDDVFVCVVHVMCVCMYDDTMMMRLMLTDRPVNCASLHAGHGCDPSKLTALHVGGCMA